MRKPTVRLDRFRVVSWAEKDGRKVPLITGFTTAKDHQLRPKGESPIYDRVRTLRSRASGTEVKWQYQRRRGWVKPWRITMVADDHQGITPEEAWSILRHCRFYRLVLIELAVDFSPESIVNRGFVKRHGLFGKSQRRFDRGGPGQLRYGARHSAKMVRCYRKKEIDSFRVEVELHSQLLRKHHIDLAADLPFVPYIVFPNHLRFVSIQWPRLQRYLEHRFGDGLAILKKARKLAEVSLHSATRYLRRKGVLNVHRFLVPLKINRAVEQALQTWSSRFERIRHERGAFEINPKN